MNSDIRLSIGFWQHPKTRKLIRRGGLEVVRSLQILWCFCAQERTNGILSGMDIDDIEIAADWQGEPGKLVELLLKGNWMEMLADSTYALHGWEERQAFVSKAESRKAHAKAAAESRWREKRGTLGEMPPHAPSIPDSCPSHMPIPETAYADSCGEHCAGHENLCSEHKKQCSEHGNFMLTHAQGDAPIPNPIPVPEEIKTPPNNDLGLKQDARVAQTVPEGGGVEEPGIEFLELRQAYDREGRKEAPLAGFEAYKALKKSRQWPGLGQIHHALESLARNDEQWRAGKAPGLAKFLREQWWRMEPRSRSSPPAAASASSLAERNLRTVQEVLEAESGGADAGH